MYNWENSAKANRKKVKKTGTVVLHPDEEIDTSFDRLTKPTLVHKRSRRVSTEEEEKELTILMTQETRDVLENTMGFKSLLRSQAQCYKGIFVGRDVILHSRTGSGKTLAYVLPIIERHQIKNGEDRDQRDGPFLLVFLFSNDLAVQTKKVISKVYPKLRVEVAGLDDVSHKPGNPVDVLIGTVGALDTAIRGRHSAALATAAEEKERQKEASASLKRPRSEKKSTKAEKTKKKGKKEKEEEEEKESSDDSGLDESSDGEVSHLAGEKGEVSAANVTSIVMDEVDTTLGPRFTNVGRRMKNLLKFIRRANGSLVDGLLTDHRVHHYVLCGATIPNWVLKAGFLGVKKYYYKLVSAGSVKLPEGLEVYYTQCAKAERVPTLVKLLHADREFFGRCVVFASPKQIENLEALLRETNAKEKQSSGKKKASDSVLSVRSLSSDLKEKDRFKAVEDFNNKDANVLLCTDVAARGIDMVEVDTVVMLSLPHHGMAAETFVHRAGRTARVGHTGKCLVLTDASESNDMDSITRTTHAVFKRYVSNTSEKGKSGNNHSASADDDDDKVTTTSPQVHLMMTVKNPFKYTQPNLQVPTAAEVLQQQLGEDFSTISIEAAKEGDTTEVVRFAVPATAHHIIKEKLWKYKLKEV